MAYPPQNMCIRQRETAYLDRAKDDIINARNSPRELMEPSLKRITN
jgi:hypothetical protein